MGNIIDGWRMKANGIYWPQQHNNVIRRVLTMANGGPGDLCHRQPRRVSAEPFAGRALQVSRSSCREYALANSWEKIADLFLQAMEPVGRGARPLQRTGEALRMPGHGFGGL